MRRWLVIGFVALVGCSKAKPLPDAILGDWLVWCYTEANTASCLSKETDGLRHTFHPDGSLDVRRADDSRPSSDKATWTLTGDELTFTFSGGRMKLVDTWRARVEDERLVLWDASSGRGQVLGRAGASFKPADSPTWKGGRQQLTLNSVTFSIELPGGYRQTHNDPRKQSWAPTSGIRSSNPGSSSRRHQQAARIWPSAKSGRAPSARRCARPAGPASCCVCRLP